MPRKGKGHSVADFILQDDGDEDDPETAALAKELAELENKRAERLGLKGPVAEATAESADAVPTSSGGYLGGSRPPLPPGDSKGSSFETGLSTGRVDANVPTEDKVEPIPKSKSVADRILGLDSAADEAEAEFARMEEDLQKQLRDFQEQRQGALTPLNKKDKDESKPTADQAATAQAAGEESKASSSAVAQMSSTGMSSTTPPATADAWKTSDVSAMMSSTGMSGTTLLTTDPPEEPQSEAAEELAKLRAQMEVIETAFPDTVPEDSITNSNEGTAKVEGQNPNSFLGNCLELHEKIAKKKEKTMRDYHEDIELKCIREELDTLDNKLGAIKKQQELKLEQRRSEAAVANAAAAGHEDMVGKLQRQNAHLRERFGHDANTGKYAKPRGLLNLDVALLNSGLT